MSDIDPISIVGLVLVVALLWVPLGAVTVACVAGVVRARRRPPAPAGRRPIVFGVLALAVALGGCAASAFMGYGYVLGTSLGGYTPPLEAALFTIATISPLLFAAAALPAAIAYLVTAIRRRQP